MRLKPFRAVRPTPGGAAPGENARYQATSVAAKWAIWSECAFGGGLIACYLWNSRVANVGPSAAALFINLVPVASMPISSVLGAPPTTAQLICGVIVIGAVSLSILGTPAPTEHRGPLKAITG